MLKWRHQIPMRYFTYIAEQSFKTSDSGERLFYRGGPWSRPYIIPDPATEQRLFRKQTWLLRLFLAPMILGQPLLFLLQPKLLHEPLWFFSYLGVMMAAFGIMGWITFARDLSRLKRAPARLQLKSFYEQMAQRHSKFGLILGFMGSLMFVLTGFAMLALSRNRSIGFLCVAFFGLCAIAWGYALFLKLGSEDSPKT